MQGGGEVGSLISMNSITKSNGDQAETPQSTWQITGPRVGGSYNGALLFRHVHDSMIETDVMRLDKDYVYIDEALKLNAVSVRQATEDDFGKIAHFIMNDGTSMMYACVKSKNDSEEIIYDWKELHS